MTIKEKHSFFYSKTSRCVLINSLHSILIGWDLPTVFSYIYLCLKVVGNISFDLFINTIGASSINDLFNWRFSNYFYYLLRVYDNWPRIFHSCRCRFKRFYGHCKYVLSWYLHLHRYLFDYEPDKKWVGLNNAKNEVKKW